MYFAKPLQIKAYEELKKMVLDGTLKHHTIYSETKISQALGISRTPLRDAIQRLSQEGYIDVIPSKGFQIHEMTQQDLLATYQIRCALEGFCVVQAAQDFDSPAAKSLFTELEVLLAAQRHIFEAGGNPKEFTEFDAEFHRKIVYYLDNRVISDTFDNNFHQLKTQTEISLMNAGRMEQTIAEHADILKYMRMGAVGRSYKAVLAHLGKAKSIIKLEDLQS